MLMNASVKRICTKYGTACVIVVEAGPPSARRTFRINAGVVVSNADLLSTVERLLGPGEVDPERLVALRQLRPSHPCFLTHIGLKDMPTETLKAAAGYHWDSWNSDEVATRAFKIFVPTL